MAGAVLAIQASRKVHSRLGLIGHCCRPNAFTDFPWRAADLGNEGQAPGPYSGRIVSTEHIRRKDNPSGRRRIVAGLVLLLAATANGMAQTLDAAQDRPSQLASAPERTDPAAKLVYWPGVDWTKIPPVRPSPRPGVFTVPVSGPGYYSLRDFLAGDFRDKPPIMPWGVFALYQPSFFDTDFRYLDKPDNTQYDCFDPVKRVHCGDDWLLSFGGQTQARFMDEADSRLGTSRNDYTLFRTRLYGDLWRQDKFRLFAEYLLAESLDPELDPLPIDINRSDLLNLFAEIKLGEVHGSPVYLRVGRQEILLGSQRLISPLEWGSTRRTFQGVRGYRVGEKWDLDAFWVQPVIPNRNDFDSVDHDQSFAGLWATYKVKPGTVVDLYFLNLDQARAVVAGEDGVLGGFNVSTIGVRFVGDYNRFLWDVEGMVQFGSYSNQDLLASAVTAGVGYHFADRAMNPQIWAYYDFASGEQSPGVGTKRSTFNQLFPFGHYYLGWIDLVGRQNVHDVSGQLALYPQPWITVLTQFHHFRLDSPRDALYDAAGRPTRRDPTGAAGINVGNEIDLAVSFHLGRHSDLLVGWSKLYSGSFLARTGPDVSPELLYVQYGFRW
jgi:hypothetical protein